MRASKRLKRSDHLLSSSLKRSSGVGWLEEAVAEGDFTFLGSFLHSFLSFFSGGGAEAAVLTVP